MNVLAWYGIICVYLFGAFIVGAFGSHAREYNETPLKNLSPVEFAVVATLWPVFFVMLVVWGLARIYSIGRKLIGD